MDLIEPEDLQWSLQVFVPQIVAGTILWMANLPSEQEENRNAIEVMLEKKDKLTQHLLIRDFLDEEEAMAWLRDSRLGSPLPSLANKSPAIATCLRR
jgi:hypothetical protein